MTDYKPDLDVTAGVKLGEELDVLVELLAENVHNVWAAERMRNGWHYGAKRDDTKKLHPCLVPYADLPEKEKNYDRNTAIGTLAFVMKHGFKIVKHNRREK